MSDNTLFRVADLVVGRPLLVHPSKAEVVMFALQNRLNLEDAGRPEPEAAARFMARRERDKSTSTIDGTAVVGVVGALSNRYSFENACAGILSYEQISMQIRAAMADPDVHSILLDLDSPGGEATGMFRLAQIVREARKSKRVVAFVDDMAASAGYGIASQADEIVVSPTSIVGSIGVVLVHLDRSEELEKRGVKPTLIHAGAHKVDGNPFGPLSDAVKADLQAEVMTFYEQFVATVAEGRPGLKPDAIKGTEARTFIGEAALAAGLADRIASIDEVLGDLRVKNALRRRGNNGVLKMSENTPPPEAGTFTQAQVDAARAEGVTAGATAERERIAAIVTSEEGKASPLAALTLALDAAALPAVTAVATLKSLASVAPPAPAAAPPAAPPNATLERRMAENPIGTMDQPQGGQDRPTKGLSAAIDERIKAR
jgi:signal peptide peptidase SppA